MQFIQDKDSYQSQPKKASRVNSKLMTYDNLADEEEDGKQFDKEVDSDISDEQRESNNKTTDYSDVQSPQLKPASNLDVFDNKEYQEFSDMLDKLNQDKASQKENDELQKAIRQLYSTLNIVKSK